MTTGFYAHGSYFAGVADPSDVDVLVVTDEDMTREDAATLVVAFLDGVPRHLPLDVDVARLDNLSIIERAVVQSARHLGGEDVRCRVKPIRAFEWAYALAHVTAARRTTARGAAALSALGALWAAGGEIVVPKSDVPRRAVGGRYEKLAAQAWDHRNDDDFDDPILDELLDEAIAVGAGEAGSREYERRGWSSRANQAAILTVFRSALRDSEVARLAAVPTQLAEVGGWTRARVDDPQLDDLVGTLALIANDWWFREPLVGIEPLGLHRYGCGSSFPPHVDRLPVLPTRALNVVAMVSPAAAGGQLFLDLGGELIEPKLAPGDVVVFDSSILHGVSRVDVGERITLVTQAHAERRAPRS